jgi:hypothetical protein
MSNPRQCQPGSRESPCRPANARMLTSQPLARNLARQTTFSAQSFHWKSELLVQRWESWIVAIFCNQRALCQ